RFLGEVAKHPEIIKSVIGASQTASTTSVARTRGARAGKLKMLGSINQQIVNLQEVALKLGAGGFSDDLIMKAKDLEHQREAVLAEIHYLDQEIQNVNLNKA